MAAEVLAILKETFGNQWGLSTLLIDFWPHSTADEKVSVNVSLSTFKVPPPLHHDIQQFVRDHDSVTFEQAWTEALHWMQEDSEMEVQTKQVQVAPSLISQVPRELWAQRASTTKTEELQTALQKQYALAQPPPWVQQVFHWCRKLGHFQRDRRARRLYEQQQGQQHGTIQDRDQGGTELYILTRGRGPCFSPQQGN